MSGGVDSSVAAAKMLEEGYEVIGLTMRVWSDSQYETAPKEGRTPHDDADEAERVARHLGIPHFELNVKETFREEVYAILSMSISGAYTQPLHCMQSSNQVQSFWRSPSLGAEKMATGHYARSGWEPDRRRYYLKKGMDSDRDQSYMLFRLNQEQLAKSIFPLGDSSKEIIRAKALQLGLNMDEKKESQEICFIPGMITANSFVVRLARFRLALSSIRAGTILANTGACLFTRSASAKGWGLPQQSPSTLWICALLITPSWSAPGQKLLFPASSPPNSILLPVLPRLKSSE